MSSQQRRKFQGGSDVPLHPAAIMLHQFMFQYFIGNLYIRYIPHHPEITGFPEDLMLKFSDAKTENDFEKRVNKLRKIGGQFNAGQQ